MNTTRIAALTVLCAGTCSPCMAGTSDWLNPADGSWLDPLNWSGGVVPGVSDDVRFEGPDNFDDSFEVTDVAGTINSLALSGRPTLRSTGTFVANDLTSTDGRAVITGPWTVGGGMLIDESGRLEVGFNSNLVVTDPLVNAGHFGLFGDSTFAEPTSVVFAGGVENSGRIYMFGQRFFDKQPFGLTVDVVGDLRNSGQIFGEQEGQVIRVHGGQVINEPGGQLGGLGIARVEGELVNNGLATIWELGAEGANHQNFGVLNTADFNDSASITNHVGATVGDWEHLTQRSNSPALSVQNDGRWTVGGEYQSFVQSPTGELELALAGAIGSIPPFFSESMRAVGEVSLAGQLSLAFERELTPEHFFYPRSGDEHLLVSGLSISGTFDSWSLEGLPSHLDAELIYSATEVRLLIVPTPGVAPITCLAGVFAVRRRSRARA